MSSSIVRSSFCRKGREKEGGGIKGLQSCGGKLDGTRRLNEDAAMGGAPGLVKRPMRKWREKEHGILSFDQQESPEMVAKRQKKLNVYFVLNLFFVQAG